MRSIKTKGRAGMVDSVLDCLMRIAAVSQNQKLSVQAFSDKYAFQVADRFWKTIHDHGQNKTRRGGALGKVQDLAAYLVAQEEA